MSLMFPRVANNYAKKGFYPTDEKTMERILNFVSVDRPGPLRIFDSCAGEGAALAELHNHIQGFGNEVQSYGVEIDVDRARVASERLTRVIHSDFMNCVIDVNAFDLMLFNPPYGDLIGDYTKMSAGEKRLEKLFFRRTVGQVRNGGVSIMILPYYVLDKQFGERISRAFVDVKIYKAVDPTFKQVVLFGKRVRNHSANAATVNAVVTARDNFEDLEVIPESCAEPYELLPCKDSREAIQFRTIRLTAELVQAEMEGHQDMLWGEFQHIFKTAKSDIPRPLTHMRPWHSAMSIISGVVHGFVTNERGQQLLIKGSCRKVISESMEVSEFDDGEEHLIEQIKRDTEQYRAEIFAIDFTEGSPDYGDVICIR